MEYRKWDDTVVWQDDKELLFFVEHGDYSWTAYGLVRDPAGRLFLITDYGCSCYGPWEAQPDYMPVESVQAAVAYVNAQADDDGYTWDWTDAEAFAKRALEVR